MERFPSNSKSRLFFTSPVCHEAGIWNIDPSDSTCVEVVLSAVELQNMKIRNLQYYISNSAQIQGLQNASSVLPWPPASFPIPLISLTGGTRQNQLTCQSDFGHTIGPSFFPWTRSDYMLCSCFHTGHWVCFMSVLACFTFSQIIYNTCCTLSDQSV